MAKYKVGDKVRVRDELDGDTQYWMEDKCDYWYPSTDMIDSVGKVVTIKQNFGNYYTCEGYDEMEYWTDEMFVGLADETPAPKVPTNKLKVGDRFRVVKAEIRGKEKFIGKVFTVSTLNPSGDYKPHYGVNQEHDCPYIWFEDEVELVKDETPTAPVTVNINLNIDIYTNACWYCRKGGLVDLYLAGRMGICPSCGRVCNETHVQSNCSNAKVIEFKPKKSNEPLTTEELNALPDGTRVFTVWLDVDHGREEMWDNERTRWRVKRNKTRLEWEDGTGWMGIESNGTWYKAYLEEPERPEPTLPF